MRFNALAAAALALLVGACTTGSLDDLSRGGGGKRSSSGGKGGSPSVDAGPDSTLPTAGNGGLGSGGEGGQPQSSCSDEMLGANETDVDCGGADCSPCMTGQTCVLDSDCASGTCDPTALVCQ